MSSEYAELCERIRAHCQRQQWYGTDHLKVSWQFWRDADGKPFTASRDLPTSQFEWPPAIQQQIDETERALGFELPAALKAVYRRVANGGFGPAYGLIGVHGGYSDALSSANSGVTLATTLRRGDWRIPERAAHYLQRHPRRFLECECEYEPDGLVTLCDWGCGLASVLDCWSGRVYGIGTGVMTDANATASETTVYARWLDFQATSVEDWFERWLRGELRQPLSNLELKDAIRDELETPPTEPPPLFEEHPDWEWYKRTAPPLDEELD